MSYILCFRRDKLSIQSQILCFGITTLLIFLIIMHVGLHTIFLLCSDILQDATSKSRIMENQAQIQRFNRLLISSTEYYIIRNQATLHVVTDFFQFIQTHQQSFTIEQPFECLNQTLFPTQIETKSLFCYEYYGNREKTNQEVNKYFLQLTSLLTEHILAAIISDHLYYVSLGEDKFFAIHNLSIPTYYNPSIRQWYTNHLKYMNLYDIVVSDPFLQMSGYIHVAFTHNLTDLNRNLIGIASKDMAFSDYPKIYNNQFSLMLANDEDYLILSQAYKPGSPDLYMVYDEDITGIQKQQWLIIKQKLRNKSQLIEYIYNTKLQQNVYLSISYLEHEHIYILLQINEHPFIQAQQEILQTYETFKIQQIYIFLYIMFGEILIAIAFYNISFALLLRKINQLNRIAQKSVFQQYFTFHRQRYYNMFNKSNSTIRRLQRAFFRLMKTKTKKNRICNQIEKLNYPKQNFDFYQTYLLQQIINSQYIIKDRPFRIRSQPL